MQVYKLFFQVLQQAKRADYYVLSYLFVGNISGLLHREKRQENQHFHQLRINLL